MRIERDTDLHPTVLERTPPAHLFTPVSAPVFSLAWPEEAPGGSWTAGIAVTPAGAFFDGRANPFVDLVLATAGFVAGP